MDGRLHLWPALSTAIEAGQGGPMIGGMRGDCDGLLELAFRSAVVLVSFRNARPQLVGAGRIDLVELRGDGLGLVHAAAHDSGGLLVKVAQIRQAPRHCADRAAPPFRTQCAHAWQAKMRSGTRPGLAFSPSARPSHGDHSSSDRSSSHGLFALVRRPRPTAPACSARGTRGSGPRPTGAALGKRMDQRQEPCLPRRPAGPD